MPAPLADRIRLTLWPPPEPELADAGRAGEVSIAKARLVLVSLLGLTALATAVRYPGELSGQLGLATAVLAIGIGLLILRRARHGVGGPALGAAATLFDVSIVSGYHLLLFAGGEADTALGSRVTFALYVLAIAATALRYDGRLVRVAGALAIVQFLAVVAWADATGRASAAATRFYGDAEPGGQMEEVLVLIAATMVGSVYVSRSRVLRLSGILDPLTRLANRSYFDERFDQELRRTARAGRPASVAIIDIDHFKRVNDTHGHAAGDAALQRVAALLRRSTRRGDVLARMGGEEFALLLPDTPLEAAREKLESLRAVLAATPLELPDGSAARLTISAGVAACPDDGDEPETLLRVADARLLAGKRAGRDTVVAAG